PSVYGATIGGGGAANYFSQSESNSVTGDFGTIGGGAQNTSSGFGATVAGGYINRATNTDATVPGGYLNVAGGAFSFAAGQQAKALHSGAFVWADARFADFASTANDQFLIRAAGFVGINKNNPATALDVNGTVTASAFAGGGASLTALNADNIRSGTLPDGR